jgi:ATP-binding cassette subfamily C protein LapB
MAARHPHGFDMAVREGGMGVSGGQRQAIAIARSLIGDPPTLIMDEPTSSMDVQTEARVIENIKSWATDQRTLIVVTHRTSLLALVDRVIVLKDGKVSFDGNKNEMIARARRPENKEALANV